MKRGRMIYPGHLGYLIPLGDDRYAHLSLPRDLTPQEAERLRALLAAVAIPPDPTIAPSESLGIDYRAERKGDQEGGDP